MPSDYKIKGLLVYNARALADRANVLWSHVLTGDYSSGLRELINHEKKLFNYYLFADSLFSKSGAGCR